MGVSVSMVIPRSFSAICPPPTSSRLTCSSAGAVLTAGVIGDAPGITENFLCLLVEKHRFGRLSEIREAYNKQYHEAFGIAEVFVTSAVPLDDAQRSALKAKLQKKLGKTIQLRERVDQTLVGGMVIQYGDTRMDNSLRTRMRQFKQDS